jgi:hypothetical protein
MKTRAHVRYLKTDEAPEGMVWEYDFPNNLLPNEEQTSGALGVIWRECNRVDGREWISKSGLKARSLSCGDVVTLDGKHYLCEAYGWKEITEADANWLVETVSFRDFCHNLATTKKLLLGEEN